jgi:hypothetical protein
MLFAETSITPFTRYPKTSKEKPNNEENTALCDSTGSTCKKREARIESLLTRKISFTDDNLGWFLICLTVIFL